MATGAVESLSPSFDLNCGIMSDSGILLCSNDIENLIVNEIERIKGSRQRADTISVCKALSKKHGLSEGVAVIAIDFMMKHDKLKKTFYAGRESLQRSFPNATTFTTDPRADPRERLSNKDFQTYDDPRRPR